LRDLPAVETLRRVWVQEYYAPEPDGQVGWRAVEDLPPAALLINSPYDDEARYSSKRDTTWTGYKVHLTETCDPDQPHLITQVETTPATTPDWPLAPVIHAALARKDLLPSEHLVDAGYVDSEVIVSSQADHQLRVIGPVPPDSSWQAQAAQGFEVACFRLDWDARRATCPTGQTSTKWAETHDRHGAPTVTIRFSSTACRACPRRADCTSSPDGPRQLTVRPRLLHEALQAGREYQTTPAFKAEYALRAGIEGTLSQGVRVADLRQARYFGLAKTHLQHVLTGAALNLRRLGAWWDERTPAATRRSPFVALATPGL
jgi:transposase